MARSDLILNLVKASRQNDQGRIRKIVESMAADERAKNHMVLADRLLAHLQVENGNLLQSPARTIQSANCPSLIETAPNRRLEDLILPEYVHETLQRMVMEQQRADLLRSHSIEPRNRVLLVGPPGNGKTTLAEAIADALHVSFLVVRYEGIIGSYLGETAQRISQVFEHARSRRCVLFFDEFDSVGKERGDTHETGEIKRVVSSLLLQIDALPSYVVVVTASNHPELLDRAVWRRFQIRIDLHRPTQHQIETWFERFQERTGHALGLAPQTLARHLEGLSFSEVEEFGMDILRTLILDQGASSSRTITQKKLRDWKKHFLQRQAIHGEKDHSK